MDIKKEMINLEIIKHDGIITIRKICNKKITHGLKKILIIEVPYKITKEYLERREKNNEKRRN